MSVASVRNSDLESLATESKPNLCIVANEQTPYRIHFHRRIVRELPEIRLHSIFTHEVSSSPWSYIDDREIHPVLFGSGESTSQQTALGALHHQWYKGGQIIRWMDQNAFPTAVVVIGYNDPTLLRIIHWCRRKRVPCFLFGDSNILLESDNWKKYLKAALLPAILKTCTGIFCCGSLGQAYFEYYGVPTSRIWRVPYEPDYDAIRNLDARFIEQVRKDYGLSSEHRYLLFSGRLVPVKRVDLLLAAFTAIAEERPDLDLVIAGDGPLAAELKAMIPATLRDRVLWTGFIADAKVLAGLYRNVDVLVLPSDYEPWGVVVTEAVAAGLAIVASSVVGAAADTVVPGLNGYVFERGDQEDLEGALLASTAHEHLSDLKQGSSVVFHQWQSHNDPIQGLRNALASTQVI